MIPATNKKLLVTEDWTKIYQSFQNADFKSYDFDTLRRAAFKYLQESYPEQFNDYIDSSEYVALIDLIAFLGQNLSFRIDLNARENFLETAQRRDSILRLAQLISYNPKRNTPASGLLKMTAVQTTDNIIDNNNVNIANQIIGWNDPSNSNWYQQFILALNSAMPGGQSFGSPTASNTINGILTDQYRINSSMTGVPAFNFFKPVNGVSMNFEVVSSTFDNATTIYEETPLPGRPMAFMWRNDNQGAGSSNTGFFMLFKQGTLGNSTFTIDTPVPNEIVGINVKEINNTDVWLWQGGSTSDYKTEWAKVDAVTGNNIIYNSLQLGQRDVYSVASRLDDQIDLNFADGNFGNLPKGKFTIFYRQSNGLQYSIAPEAMNSINIIVPYINKAGENHTLTLTLSLQYSVYNSAPTESTASIKQKAPQNYYIQNRMITGEDYNIAPVTIASDILKVKSINRQSSGVSKYFDLNDVTGKYSKTDIFAQDGMIYKEFRQTSFTFTFGNRNEAFGVLKTQIEPLIGHPSTRNFYYERFPRPQLSNINLDWYAAQHETNQTRGFFKDLYFTDPSNYRPAQVGSFSSNNAMYVTVGALIKFTSPEGKYFLPSGKLTTVPDATTRTYIWSKVAKIVGDGSNSGQGLLYDGSGPVTLTGYVPAGAIAVEVIPTLITNLPFALENEIVNQITAKRNFGLSFDRLSRQWGIITDTNVDLKTQFNLIYQGDTTNLNIDSSWQVGFQWTGKAYKVFYRQTNYVFESKEQTSFFVDNYKTNFDFVSNSVIKDKISVLSINPIPNLGNTWHSGTTPPSPLLGLSGDFYLNTTNNIISRKIDGVWKIIPAGQTINELGKDFNWQIDSSVVENDGYVEPKKVLISFFDSNNDGQIDDPDSFEKITDSQNPSVQTGYLGNFIYFEKLADGLRYKLLDTAMFTAYPSEDELTSAIVNRIVPAPTDGDLFYFYTADVIKKYNATELTYDVQNIYFARSGRSDLKFHYSHNSGVEKRIDPAKSNIIDIYLLTSEYDIAYRKWLIGGLTTEPSPPTSSQLEDTYAPALEEIKSISDALVYHPATYKVLFGSKATPNLQATFRAVKTTARSVSDNDIRTRILSAISDFFTVDNWDFGDTFYFSELSTYVMNVMSPDITNFVIVPKNGSSFGNLFEIASQGDEIFVNGATVNDIEVVGAITLSNLTVD